jgi:hypothetical protein
LTHLCDLLTSCSPLPQEGPGFFFEKGNMSNVFTFAVMLAGIAMRFSMDSPWDENAAGRCVERLATPSCPW